ncbi:hypothetical protein ACMBCN_01375 [Candidatus Liberibacter asiaticus]
MKLFCWKLCCMESLLRQCCSKAPFSSSLYIYISKLNTNNHE